MTLRGLQLSVIAVLLVVFAQITVSGEEDDVLLVTIDQERIGAQDLKHHLAINPLMASGAMTPGGLDRALSDLIAIKLLVREGNRTGVPRPADHPDDDIVYAYAVRSRLFQECEQQQKGLDPKAYYESHPDTFSTPPLLKVRRIARQAKGGETEATMKKLAGELKQGELTFEQAVERYSEDALTKEYGGDLGYIPVEGETELDTALLQGSVNDIIGPIRQKDEWFIYQISARRDPQLVPFDAEQVTDTALKQCRRQVLEEFKEQAGQRWKVTYHFDAPLTFDKLDGK